MKKILCCECGFDCSQEIFMLTNEVWFQIVGRHTYGGGILCVGCCEKKLGRQLTKEDFSNNHANRFNFGHKTARLINRLRRSSKN